MKVYPTSKFWKSSNKDLSGAVVLGFGGIQFEEIEPAIKLLRKAWISDN